MSYPAPPPPGGAGQPNPYQSTPYGAGPAGPAPKKDNTLLWILGIIGAVILLCCCGVGGFFLWAANEADDAISSYSSSADAGKDADAASAQVIGEGSSATVDGAAIRPGWSESGGDISGLAVRNDSGSSDSFYLTFYFMKDGSVVEDIVCTTDYLDAGATDYSASCVGAFDDLGDVDEIRVREGV